MLGSVWGRGIGVAVLAAAGAVSGAGAQGLPAGESAAYVPTMTFDVVSIHEDKPSPDGRYMIGGPDAPRSGSFSGTYRASDLVAMAYGVDSRNISGGPGWVPEVRYVIKARSDAGADEALVKLTREQARAEKRHMLQVMLEERFKLKAHRVTKDATVFQMVVGKGGPKFAESKVVVVEGGDAKAVDEANRRDGRQSCGPAGCEMTAVRYAMSNLASELGGQLNSKVEDKTGLTGKYDFKLLWTYRDFAEPGDDGTHPPLRVAVREQLGLELKPAKGTLPGLVVDGIEKPSEN